jgi:cellulose synthase/poly-beta-1,6-N-acetylglucosamine synthase-like glycosyltransferase
MLFLEILYLLSAAGLAVYGLNSLLLTWLHHRRYKKVPPPVVENIEPDVFPPVTVQLPIYNERHVVERLLEAVANLNWPTEKLQIQILDDSTDDTQTIIRAALGHQQQRRPRLDFQYVRRPHRHNFKAGALQYGLSRIAGDFVAIFDADFVPPPDFLRKTVPLFDRATVGCVQTRWGHLNPNSSRLTRSQALGIDGHFVVEQAVRHALDLFLNFNGTAGVWRRTCMVDAGGWQGDTLTEDLDLSYRAQLRGWQIIYQPQVITPAELPVQIDAFKRQQFRWAKGSIQTAKKLLGQLWNAPKPGWVKLLGTLHLTNYAVHPLMLVNLLLTLPMMSSHSIFLQLTPLFALSALGPPLLYWAAMKDKSESVTARLGRLALLVALGTGVSYSNSRAVWQALTGISSDFKRTPKFAVTDQPSNWQASRYTLPRDPSIWIELGLALYALGLLGWAVSQGVWWLIPWLVLYSGGYSYVTGLTFVQTRQTRAARRAASA